jgi:hypothetical protein
MVINVEHVITAVESACDSSNNDFIDMSEITRQSSAGPK